MIGSAYFEETIVFLGCLLKRAFRNYAVILLSKSISKHAISIQGTINNISCKTYNNSEYNQDWLQLAAVACICPISPMKKERKITEQNKRLLISHT